MEKATVIINTYNEKPEYLRATVEAFLNQVGVDLQIIISTVEGDPAIYGIYNGYPIEIDLCISKRPGIYYQLNNAMKLATGDWITYMSSNDIPTPDKIISEIRACNEANVITKNHTVRPKKSVCHSSIIDT